MIGLHKTSALHTFKFSVKPIADSSLVDQIDALLPQTQCTQSALTGQAVVPLNPDNGEHEPRLVAVIDEPACIGCKLCIKACPVDCIVGAGKRMHTVIADECTGCKLCVPVCPTDCINLIDFAGNPETEQPSRWPEFSQRQVDKARMRTNQKIIRIAKKEAKRT